MRPARLSLYLLLTIGTLTHSCQSRDSSPGSTGALDEKNGFQDSRFGMPLSAFTGMVPVDKNNTGDYKKYTRPSYKGMMGDIPLSLVEYTFYKDMLISIRIQTKGEQNGSAALQTLSAAYGPGKETSGNGRAWSGENVLMYYTPGYYIGEHVYTSTIIVSSFKMEREIVQARKEEGQERAGRNAGNL